MRDLHHEHSTFVALFRLRVRTTTSHSELVEDMMYCNATRKMKLIFDEIDSLAARWRKDDSSAVAGISCKGRVKCFLGWRILETRSRRVSSKISSCSSAINNLN